MSAESWLAGLLDDPWTADDMLRRIAPGRSGKALGAEPGPEWLERLLALRCWTAYHFTLVFGQGVWARADQLPDHLKTDRKEHDPVLTTDMTALAEDDVVRQVKDDLYLIELIKKSPAQPRSELRCLGNHLEAIRERAATLAARIESPSLREQLSVAANAA